VNATPVPLLLFHTLRTIFNWIYGKERFGTIPGAVATGSMAPGRYRSRYCTAPQPGRLNESPDTEYSFAIRARERFAIAGTITTTGRTGGRGEKKMKSHCSTLLIPVIPVSLAVVLCVHTIEIRANSALARTLTDCAPRRPSSSCCGASGFSSEVASQRRRENTLAASCI